MSSHNIVLKCENLSEFFYFHSDCSFSFFFIFFFSGDSLLSFLFCSLRIFLRMKSTEILSFQYSFMSFFLYWLCEYAGHQPRKCLFSYIFFSRSMNSDFIMFSSGLYAVVVISSFFCMCFIRSFLWFFASYIGRRNGVRFKIVNDF